jgi:hypothetical protein
MKFYEHGSLIEVLPDWVSSSIKLGYALAIEKDVTSQKVHLISAPFKSSIAPLIALGALRASLEKPDDNLCHDYLSFLLSAREKLLSVQKDSPRQWHIRKHNEPDKQYSFSPEIDNTGIAVIGQKKGRGRSKREPVKSWIMEPYAKDWQLNGLPPTRSLSEPDPLHIKALQSLPECPGSVREDNFMSSFLGHILVAPSAIENSNYIGCLRKSGFSIDDIKIPMSDLLMLGEDSKSTISRMTLIGERQLDTHMFYQAPSLIISDGAKATTNAWNNGSTISNSNLIGIINRCGSAEAIEEFEITLQEKERYYKNIKTPIQYQSPYIQIRSMERSR